MRPEAVSRLRIPADQLESPDDVRDAVSRVRADLPADLRDPIIKKVELAGVPILTYTAEYPRADATEEVTRALAGRAGGWVLADVHIVQDQRRPLELRLGDRVLAVDCLRPPEAFVLQIQPVHLPRVEIVIDNQDQGRAGGHWQG